MKLYVAFGDMGQYDGGTYLLAVCDSLDTAINIVEENCKKKFCEHENGEVQEVILNQMADNFEEDTHYFKNNIKKWRYR